MIADRPAAAATTCTSPPRPVMRPARVNGQPGAVVADAEGRVVSVMALDIAGGGVHGVVSIVNPDKLGHPGPVGDVRALLERRER